ncbi:cob(I)yrinic acid a,c-diamide adenosyltransferase [Pedobacter flavus]|uniref:Corrinoid adenosyltransferase n=1 Tax=Pedobacter flavus TaxID=3113906 RepID=A0ABU7H3F6_9SPHI|nr:cob(I)yrinic acid a,c-diamide adenosyltransferase [Pedobacter sp. VNH31]MEE1885860.1 cob(I)yrinic acid a,c-diamide adenosyltransferase [Pedobacter sp. VNH31]
MKIYTKTGDKGLTSLIGGKRVPKNHERIEAYGTVDELNSYIGLISTQKTDPETLKILKEIQDRLFTIGATLAADPETSRMKIPDLHNSDIELLEREIDKINLIIPPLKHFVLPGGTEAVAFCHVARCVCRRAERLVVGLAIENEIEEKVIIYLNRLSDYLFVLSRKFNIEAGAPENIWEPRV